jgi:hypothetical protein
MLTDVRQLGDWIYVERTCFFEDQAYRTKSWRKLMPINRWQEDHPDTKDIPLLILDSRLVAWRNGWYVPLMVRSGTIFVDLFVPYTNPQDLPSGLGEAIKFFDQDFRNEKLDTFEEEGKSFKDFTKISIPTDEIFVHWTLQEQKLMAAMVGRLQQPLHRYDRYNRLTIVEGTEQGTKLLADLVNLFYEDDQVITDTCLDNVLERFVAFVPIPGIEALLRIHFPAVITDSILFYLDDDNNGAKAFICSLNEDENKDEALLLSMSTGDPFGHQSLQGPIPVEWNLPGLLHCVRCPKLFQEKARTWKERLFIIDSQPFCGPSSVMASIMSETHHNSDRVYRKFALAYAWLCQVVRGRQITTYLAGTRFERNLPC